MKNLILKRARLLWPLTSLILAMLMICFSRVNAQSINGTTNIVYYTGDFYPEIKGKVKSIGSTDFTYYTGNFYPEISGKIKSIGNTNFTYYTGDFYPEIKGKIKSIDNTTFTYYTGDFYPELKGKIKTIEGNLPEQTMYLLFPELNLIN